MVKCSVFAAVFLVAVEVFLRISGFILADVSAKTGVHREDKNKVKILVLGESTSDEDMAKESNSKSWPRLLEEILFKRGFDIRIYNTAKAGTNTYFILRDLNSNLDFYKPDIVISMMGINDSVEMGAFSDNLFHDLKIYKLVKWYLFFQPQFYGGNESPEPEFAEELEKVAAKIERNHMDLDAIKNRVKELGLGAQGAFQFYEGLVFRLVFRSQLKEKNYSLLNRLIDTAFVTGFYGYDLILSKIYVDGQVQNEKSCVEFMIKMAERQSYQFSEEQISMSLFCRLNNSSLKKRWDYLMEGQKNSIRFSNDDKRESTKFHYLKIARYLAERKIKFFVMGYPTRSIASVKSFFAVHPHDSELAAKVSFVSNQENFTAALREKNFDEVFSDRFAGDFGHATEFGNQLIAENIAAHVTEFLRAAK